MVRVPTHATLPWGNGIVSLTPALICNAALVLDDFRDLMAASRCTLPAAGPRRWGTFRSCAQWWARHPGNAFPAQSTRQNSPCGLFCNRYRRRPQHSREVTGAYTDGPGPVDPSGSLRSIPAIWPSPRRQGP